MVPLIPALVPDKAGKLRLFLRQGIRKNDLLLLPEIRVLEPENAGLPDMIRQYLGLGEKQPACPSGINGAGSSRYPISHTGLPA